MNVITMGAHILDVLVRPVTDIPPRQETALVEQMRITAADHIHLGGTEMLGPDFASRILKHAKENNVTTTIDLIARGGRGP
jgi:hypothetical protein